MPKSDPKPAISVITVTRQRLDILKRKLETLKAQSLPPEQFELVLCVNGDPDTLRVVKDWQTPFALELLSFEKNMGSAKARNVCVARARAPLLYLSDDDALLNPDTLQKHLEFHQNNETCVVVGGVDWEYEGELEPMRPQRVNYWNLHAVNTSLPKEVFTAAGGFPEWLTTYGFEDILLGYALAKRGVPLVALPEVAVRHLGANPMRGLQPDKAHSAGQNAVRIVQKYPELAFRLGVHPFLLLLKRIALRSPLSVIWKSLNEGSFRYERAYLEGALEEKRHV